MSLHPIEKQLSLRVIPHASPPYEEEVALRDTVLRKPLGLAFTREELAKESDSHHLGAYRNDELVACLVLRPAEKGRVHMRQVAVDPSLQGWGIGRTLVEFSESFALTKGFNLMFLHARETAVPFYLHLGYKICSERFIEVTIPHWEMEKPLP